MQMSWPWLVAILLLSLVLLADSLSGGVLLNLLPKFCYLQYMRLRVFLQRVCPRSFRECRLMARTKINKVRVHRLSYLVRSAQQGFYVRRYGPVRNKLIDLCEEVDYIWSLVCGHKFETAPGTGSADARTPNPSSPAERSAE